jgi:chemotaxis protein methyltransferase CheR
VRRTTPSARGSVPHPTRAELTRLIDLVRTKLGISFSEQKRGLIVARLGHLLEDRGIPSYARLLESVESGFGPATYDDLADVLSTNHTFFFREPAHFEFLGKRVLADLGPRLGGPQPVIRIWSAACSTGEEPWSIAITLRQYLGLRAERTSVGILATDVSQRVLDVAGRGRYTGEKLAGLSLGLRRQWFRKEGDGTWEVRETLREDVVFRRLNLLSKLHFKVQFDVVFCRNVMIYFDEPTRTGLLHAIYDVVRPGGYLFVGLAESLAATRHPFRYVRPGIFQREVR